MPNGIGVRRDENQGTQLHAIRDLMIAAGRRGAWLTLGEIAGLTEIGEASISAQLRHLRKRRYGSHLVEKRRRRAHAVAAGSPLAAGERQFGRKRIVAESAMWEYRVLPSSGCGTAAATRQDAPEAPRVFSGGAQPPAEFSRFLNGSETSIGADARIDPGQGTVLSEDVAVCGERRAEGVHDAEAGN
jgi:hypothetical protein